MAYDENDSRHPTAYRYGAQKLMEREMDCCRGDRILAHKITLVAFVCIVQKEREVQI